MPIVNRVADLHAEITTWRRDIHAHPELLYDVHRTAASVADKLKTFGCDEVRTGVGHGGVVGVIRGRKGRKGARGRAARRHGRAADRGGDRPALSLDGTGPHARLRPRRPHHHAARRGAHISPPRATSPAPAVVIFQPAEEGGGGARRCSRRAVRSVRHRGSFRHATPPACRSANSPSVRAR